MRVEQSRIPRIESIPPHHLVLAAREWLFRGDTKDPRTKEEIECILRNAKRRGSEEAGWILEQRAEDEDTPRGIFYVGSIMYGMGDVIKGRSLIEKSAKLGYPPAMSKFGFLLSMHSSVEEGMVWINAAAAKGDYDGLILKSAHAYEMGSNYSIPSTVPGHHIYNGRYWLLNQPLIMLFFKTSLVPRAI